MFKRVSAVIAAAITGFILLAPGARAASGDDFLWGDCSGTFSYNLTLTNQDGRLETFWVGADHQLWHQYQVSSTTWSPAYSLSGYLTSCITGQRDVFGKLEVFTRAGGGDLDYITQTGPNGSGGGWGAWRSLGGLLSSNPSGILSSWVLSDNGIEVAVFGVDGIWHYKWQQANIGFGWTPTWH